jgi:hypothetical protein
MGNEMIKKNLAKKRVSTENPIVQRKSVNSTGLPDTLQRGTEGMSGISLDDVRVHYNSPKPAQLNAMAYTQGTEIHVAPGQEANLPHEAWHVVQQKQGRVAPTMQMKGITVNNDSALEQEADTMGNKILQAKMQEGAALSAGHAAEGIIQMASQYAGIMPSHNTTLKQLEKKMEGQEDQTFHRMDLTYHHIIPEEILKEVFTQSLQPIYKYCLAHTEVKGANELIKAVNVLIESGKKLRDLTKENDVKELGKASENHEFEFSEDVVEQSKKEERRSAINGDFGAAIRWIPGNIHQGPNKRTHLDTGSQLKDADSLAKLYKDGQFNEEFIRDNPDLLTGDGGSGFEYAAVNAVGNDRIKVLAQLLTDMFKLPHFAEASKPKSGDKVHKVDEYPEIQAAIIDVTKIITTINSLFYDQTAEEKDGQKPLLVPTMNLGQWEKTEDKPANKAEWKLKNEQERQLKVQVKPGRTNYRNVERMFSKMSELADEMNKYNFLKNSTEITMKILESNEVKELANYLEEKADSYDNTSMIMYLRRWYISNQDAYMKLLQNFKRVSKRFLTQQTDSKKKISGCVMVKSSYDKLYMEYLSFQHFFGR